MPILQYAPLVVWVCFGVGATEIPMHVDAFPQQRHHAFTEADGLPSNDVLQLGIGLEGTVYAKTSEGTAHFDGERWKPVDEVVAKTFFDALPWRPGFGPDTGAPIGVRAMDQNNSEFAVAAENGIFVGNGEEWELVLPREGHVRWAPVDVRTVGYDSEGRLWFASPQGAGFRVAKGQWRLFTGKDGLPFSDFTCMAPGPEGQVWFGTTNGAIRYIEGNWEFRQGRRWLIDNHVRDIVVTPDGAAWFATPGGVSRISARPMTLSEKADFYLAEIDRYHRYSPFGYVSWAFMTEPGKKGTARARDTDNDGHYTGTYLAAVSLGYAVTRDPKLKQDAQNAFRALAFLSEVTEGGSHPAPKGFVARAIVSADERDPNIVDNPEVDRKRRTERDAMWKIMDPRWPLDATGQWYWKCDSSSDELDGHFFGYGTYYDRVCEVEEEKEAVRIVVRRITDHILAHNWSLTDHDGRPTRWARFAPEEINQNQFWWVERGLNSLSILTFLSVTYHITGDPKYREAFLELAWEHGYAMNGMTQPKAMLSPGAFGQGDDNMAFMNYYHLLRYETDPVLQDMFRNAAYWHWQIEKFERNPFLNFVYAACNLGKVRVDQWRTMDLSPAEGWLEDSVFTLKRYPLDLVDWPMSNAHRLDLVPLHQFARGPGPGHVGTGYRVGGYTFPIDENHAVQSGQDPWVLTRDTDGLRLNTGVSFLLAYYMARFHGFIRE